jgi:hypothetical protein
MQKILVFQQNRSGMSKIAGIKRFGGDRFDVKTFDIDESLPNIIDDESPYLPDRIDADIVLDYLKHPDISCDLALLCQKLGIPVIASGKKINQGDVITPITCCMLSRNSVLGDYGELFGAPDIHVEFKDNCVDSVDVIRGAPCGATWITRLRTPW